MNKTWIVLIFFSFLSTALVSSAQQVSPQQKTKKHTRQPASSKSKRSLRQLISLEKFKALSAKQKNLYIGGLQRMALDMNRRQKPSKHKTAFETLFVTDAYADSSESSSCVFAGYFEARVGGACPTPSVGSCVNKPGTVECNPLLFGEGSDGVGVCVAPNDSATSQCINNPLPHSLDSTKAYIENHPAAWTNLQTSLTSYCNGTAQVATCNYTQLRLGEVASTVAATAPAPAYAPAAPVAPSNGGSLLGTSVPGGVGAPVNLLSVLNGPPAQVPVANQNSATPPPTSSNSDPGYGQVPNVNLTIPSSQMAQTCRTDELIETVRCSEDDDDYRSLMSVSEVYNDFCESQGVLSDASARIQSRIAGAQSCLTKQVMRFSQMPSLNATDNYEYNRVKDSLNRLNNELIPNYNKCLSDLRSGNFPKVAAQGSITFSGSGDDSTVRIVNSQFDVTTDAEDAGLALVNPMSLTQCSPGQYIQPHSLCEFALYGTPPDASIYGSSGADATGVR